MTTSQNQTPHTAILWNICHYDHWFCQTEYLFYHANLFLETIQNRKERMTKTDWGKKKVLKSESEVKWNRWKKGDGEEKRQKELMGSGAGPDFYWRLGLALARRDKREIIIRPAEAWQPLLGTAERQTEHYVKDWPCHWQRHLLTDSGVWSFSWW